MSRAQSRPAVEEDQGRALSSRGSFVLVAESGHNLPQEVPDRVLASVREMLSRLRQ